MKIQKYLSLTICLVFMLSIPSYSEEAHDHDHGSHEEEERHDEKHEHDEIQTENQDEYEDDRHVPEKKEEEHDEHGDEAHHDDGHDEEEGEVSSNVGPGSAVTEADHEKGFRLSEKAHLSLEIETKEVKSKRSFTLPKESIVFSKDEIGVYRHRNGWFKLIEGQVSKKDRTHVIFRPDNQKDFQGRDRVAIKGVPLLRVTELDAFTAEAAGHAH